MRLIFSSLLMLLAAPVLAAGEADAEPPVIQHEPCVEYQRGESFEIWARFFDKSQIFDPKVIYRIGKSPTWKHAPLKRVGETQDFKASLKPKQLRGNLEYFIEVFDEMGNGPARFGSPERPVEVKPVKTAAACRQIPTPTTPGADTAGAAAAALPLEEVTAAPVDGLVEPSGGMLLLTVQPPPPASSGCDASNAPIYCSPVFWGVVAAGVVVAGGTTLYFVTRPDEEVPTKGRVGIVITGPSPTAR